MSNCSKCGSPDAQRMKHLPLPNLEDGWIELSKSTYYCTPCAKKASNENYEMIKKAKELANNVHS